jgi:hypothetical protein
LNISTPAQERNRREDTVRNRGRGSTKRKHSRWALDTTVLLKRFGAEQSHSGETLCTEKHFTLHKAAINLPDFYQGCANPINATPSSFSAGYGTDTHRHCKDAAAAVAHSPVQMVFWVGTRPTTSRSSPVLILPAGEGAR